MKGQFWTAEEIQTLLSMIDRPIGEIAAAIPTRTKRAIRKQRQVIQFTDDERAERGLRRKATDADRYLKIKESLSFNMPRGGVGRPPADVLAERDRRLARPFDIRIDLLGEPEPGRSALDRRVSA